MYELQAEGLKGMRFEECIPFVRERLEGRMRWVWEGDLEGGYETEREKGRVFPTGDGSC